MKVRIDRARRGKALLEGVRAIVIMDDTGEVEKGHIELNHALDVIAVTVRGPLYVKSPFCPRVLDLGSRKWWTFEPEAVASE